MAARIYYKSSKPKRKTAPKPTTSTTVTGRRVKRRPEAKPTKAAKPVKAAKPKKSAKARKATAPLKASKPKNALKPRATAKRQAIPAATIADHRVTSTAKKSKTFSLDAPAGLDVAVAGSFNNWEPQAMTKGQDGLWRITLQLVPGIYQYRFLVDTEWRDDPNSSRKTIDQMKGFISVCEVV